MKRNKDKFMQETIRKPVVLGIFLFTVTYFLLLCLHYFAFADLRRGFFGIIPLVTSLEAVCGFFAPLALLIFGFFLLWEKIRKIKVKSPWLLTSILVFVGFLLIAQLRYFFTAEAEYPRRIAFEFVDVFMPRFIDHINLVVLLVFFIAGLLMLIRYIIERKHIWSRAATSVLRLFKGF